jgi:hypothetical protein
MARIDQYSTRQPSRTDILLGTDEPTGRTSNFSLADLEDFLLSNKGDRKIPIERRVNLTQSEPENPAQGGRYLNTHTGTSSITSTAVVADYIYELRAGEWFELIPVEGFTLWDKNDKQNITYAGVGYGWVSNTVSGAQLLAGLDGVNNSLDQNFTFDENGNITGFSEAFTSTVNTTVAGEGFATAQSVTDVGITLGTLQGNFTAKVTDDAIAFGGIAHTFRQDEPPTDADPKFIRNSVWYDTNDGNKAYVLEPASDVPGAALVWVEATDARLGQLITEVGAQKNILVDTNGHVAGMTIGNLGPDKSYVSFLADRFKIYTYNEDTAGGIVSSPFEVVGNTVKVTQLATRAITVGDIPAEAQSTVIFATTSNGANPSTSKFDTDASGNVTLTRTHVFLANTRWVDGDSLDNSWVFEKIAGVDGTSVSIKGSLPVGSPLPTTGNTAGDGYLIDGDLYVWDGSQWNNAGQIQGPDGNDGITPSFGLDYRNGVDGSFHSYIYKVSDTQPTRPPSTGTAFYQGSFDGVSEIIPNGWTDSPSISTEDTEWVSKAIYENNKTYDSTTGAETSVWTKRTTAGNNWSEPTKIFQKGSVGDNGAPGVDAYTVVLTNESHSVAVDKVGNHDYTGSGTNIVAYKGSTQLQGRVSGTPGAGQFRVTANVSGIQIDGSPVVPSNSNDVHIPDMRDMTNDTASISYSINLEDEITVTKKQTFTKSKEGQTGETGAPGAPGVGTNGSPGKKTATGLIFYQVSSANAPALPNTNNTSFDFTDGSVSGLGSNWNTSSPSLGPGTSTSTFWSARYYVVETNANSDIGTLTFDTPVSMYSFDQVVTFTALGAPGDTIIDGGRIKTSTLSADTLSSGTIKSNNHSGNSVGSAMSNSGTAIDLTTGAVSSENFRIDASGNAEFSGTMKIGGNTLTEENTFNLDESSGGSLIPNTTFKSAAKDGRPLGVKSSHATGALKSRIKYSSNGELEISGQSSIGACFPAFKVNQGTKYNVSVRLKQSVSASSGLYLRMEELDEELPSGKTHIVKGASSSTEEGVVEKTREVAVELPQVQDIKIDGVGSTSINNIAVTTAFRDFEFTYVPTVTAKYASLNILNWSGTGNTAMYVERVYAAPVTVDAVTLLQISPNATILHDPPTTESTGLIYTFQSRIAGPAQLKLIIKDAEARGTYPNYEGVQASVNGVALETKLNGADQETKTFYETVQVVEGENSLNVWSNWDGDGGKLVEAEIVYIQTDDKKSGTVGGWTVDSDAIYSGSKDTNGFKSNGGITLSSAGSIHAKDFYIDTSGNANFRGTMTIGGTDLDEQNTFNSNTSKSDVGLGNVDNTSDQALKNSLVKGDVGLGNVDNTSDSTLLSNAENNANTQEKTAGKVGGWKIDSDAIYTGTKDTNRFSENGFTLSSNGTLHSKQFFIDEYGNAEFQGKVHLTVPSTIYRGEQMVLMQPNRSRILILHEDSEYYGNDGGLLDLDSDGIDMYNQGRRCFDTDPFSGEYRAGDPSLASVVVECKGWAATLGLYNSAGTRITHDPGTRFVTGIYARATNSYPGDEKYHFEPLGAVIEDIRADGFVQRLYNTPAGVENSPTLQLPDNYVLYVISDSRRKVYLPQNPKTGQTVKVIRTGGSETKLVYANYTSTIADATDKIYYLGSSGSDWDTYVEVTYCEEFIWTGVYWLRNRMD